MLLPRRRGIALCLLACCFVGFVATEASRGWAVEHTRDSIEKIQENLEQDKAVLVDVREKRETDEGYVREAELTPLSKLRAEAGKKEFREALCDTIPRDKIVYTYCRSGRRSVVAAEILQELGYKQVRPLKQGFKDLVQQGFEAAKE